MKKAGGSALVKPLTFMNLSGFAVSRLRQFFQVEPCDILVIVDEVALLGALPPGWDRHAMERDVSLLVAQYIGASLRDLPLATVVSDMMDLVRRYGVRVPSELALLAKTVSMLEALSRRIDPDINVIAVVDPIIRDAMRQFYSPAFWVRRYRLQPLDALRDRELEQLGPVRQRVEHEARHEVDAHRRARGRRERDDRRAALGGVIARRELHVHDARVDRVRREQIPVERAIRGERHVRHDRLLFVAPEPRARDGLEHRARRAHDVRHLEPLGNLNQLQALRELFRDLQTLDLFLSSNEQFAVYERQRRPVVARGQDDRARQRLEA